MAILVVEDDHELTDVLVYILRREGHEVHVAFDGSSALKLWEKNHPNLVLLDIGLPGADGWEVCTALRQSSDVPIIMLSGFDRDDDIVHGLELGADDYIVKPFSPRQLLARIRAVLRRSSGATAPALGQPLHVVDLELDPQWRRVRRGNDEIPLTRFEFSVLYELALHAGQILAYRYIIEKVWGYQGLDDASLIKGHIRNLRRKLGCRPDGKQYIETVREMGYLFLP